jgi:hypothetical protein
MKHITSIAGVAMVGILAIGGNECLAGESPAFGTTPAASPPAFAVCRGTVTVSGSARPGLPGGPLKVNIYLSDVMPWGPVNDDELRYAFEKFVNEKYGQQYGGWDCRPAGTREEAQRIRDVDFRQGLENQTFIDTGWQYTPPAKAAAPAPEHYAACWANLNTQVKYYSAVFDGSRDDASKWGPAFHRYLQQQYGFDGPAQCIPARARADAQSYLATLIDKDRKTRTMQGAAPQIVETGWTY